MPGIFICYRRDDTAGHTGRLFDRLRETFGQDRVFLDVAGIEAGVDFTKAIERAVGSCEVLLAMVGKDWVTLTDAAGRRRLDDPQDFIRLEIATALSRDIRVIPVLVEGARVPDSAVLPDELKPLNHRQAVELRDSRWDADVKDLLAMLEKVIAPPAGAIKGTGDGGPAPRVVSGTGSGRPRRSGLWWFATLLGLATIGVALYVFFFMMAPVPNVMDLDRPAALQVLAAAGFKPLEVGSLASGVHLGQVIRQNPAAETRVWRGRPVTIVFAAEGGRMPEVTGKLLPVALEDLLATGLDAEVDQQESTATENVVLRQEPHAGEDVTKGTRVTLVVASRRAGEKETVTVPSVLGQPVDGAIETLKQAGLAPDARAGKPDPGVAVKSVVRQSPTAGTAVAKGTRVEIVFVPPRATVTMPEVAGKPWPEARAILEKAGIAANVVQVPDDKDAPDTVVSQRPPPGTELEAESATAELKIAVAVQKKPLATVVIYYGEGSEAAARGLAEYFRGLNNLEVAGIKSAAVSQGQFRYFFPEDAKRAEGLSNRALYWLKNNGRGDVTFAPFQADPNRVGKVNPGTMEVWIPAASGKREPRVRTKQVLRIPPTSGADLDEGVLAPAESADIWFESGKDRHRYLSPMNGVGFGWSPRSPGTATDCAEAKYGLTNLDVERFSRGAWALCVRTNGGRYAILAVRGLVGGSLEVSFITWEK
jgi:beta-lactam-binding protein with PASTA domain